jgi:hypothetical protein
MKTTITYEVWSHAEPVIFRGSQKLQEVYTLEEATAVKNEWELPGSVSMRAYIVKVTKEWL